MKKISIFVCACLLLAACAKNETIIYGWLPDNSSDNGNTQENAGALVSFSASLENRAITRAMSPMSKGVLCQILAFKTEDNKLATPLADGQYVTSSIGKLTGVKGYKMYLPDGVYNMYALSNNSSVTPPAISNGMTSPLQNGVDYLWWENIEQDITTSQIQVPIVFKHVAAQVVIDISAGESMRVDSLVSASILPSAPGGTLDLQFGIISPATTYTTTPFKMGRNGLRAQAIVLPINTTSPMTLNLELMVNGESASRNYTAGIPVPGKLAGGFSYVFSAIINGNSISFPEVSIKDWTEVDETGNPIYPK